ncbi:MAG TPA: FliA/WhiG family RNA polymerase sigma factor [Sedimentisphaerales bacterium]|nr:FliA/WhiG family RNA polymerase sigma factor [Sedimentisphaerales bacterium]HRS10852.1 FliA/WhiG family RNA polymerase sigma factor [Sedimentisphaerales bacterium]HRV47557.1 FliA/WhiG family RNA polymerase sigma factor [Sedimentisphaerales bacterium]
MTARTDDLLETAEETAAGQAAEKSDHLKAVALRTYSGHRPRSITEHEIVELLPMVRQIAQRAASYLRPPLSFEDLVSAGTVGLLKAARDFDASRQAEFKTYAYIRIKGAVLDELRRASPLPSNINRQVRHALRVSQSIAQRTGSAPTDEQLAEELGISVDEVAALFESARAQHFVSLDGFGAEQPALGEILASADTAAPDHRLEKAEMLKKLTAAMQKLDERRLQIIVLYYHKHLTMKQIADLLEITESRVSQLHASALVILSGQLGEYRDDGY